MSNSHDEIDISKIIKAMEKNKKNKLFIKNQASIVVITQKEQRKQKKNHQKLLKNRLKLLSQLLRKSLLKGL